MIHHSVARRQSNSNKKHRKKPPTKKSKIRDSHYGKEDKEVLVSIQPKTWPCVGWDRLSVGRLFTNKESKNPLNQELSLVASTVWSWIAANGQRKAYTRSPLPVRQPMKGWSSSPGKVKPAPPIYHNGRQHHFRMIMKRDDKALSCGYPTSLTNRGVSGAHFFHSGG